MVTQSGAVYNAHPVSMTVSQLMFPTSTPTDRVAFRAALATQRLTVLLTGTTITDNRPDAAVTYVSYLPSIFSVTKAVSLEQGGNKGGGGGGIGGTEFFMTDQSPIVFSPDKPAGFVLSIDFQRNTILVTKYAKSY